MKYVIVIANIVIGLLIISQGLRAEEIDFTTQNFPVHACELFANDAYQAANSYESGAELYDMLELIDGAPVAESMKHRAFQAIQFVWKNQIDNPTLAYNLAMGLCLTPKKEMTLLDEAWVTSLRTSRKFF